MARKKIKKYSIVELPSATGSISDTLNIEDKITNAPSIRLMIDLIYPIGRGFIDFTDTDYSNYLGLKWERELVGMTPIGKNVNDTDFATVGQKGGEKKHTLTVNEMPSHSHQTGIQNNQSFNATIVGDQGSTAQVLFNQYGTQTTSTGGGQAHNNLPPYQVVSYWKRVDPNAKTMISFTLNSTSYQAEEGMTWEEWCNSNYNTDGYYVSGNYVYSSSGRSVSRVTPTSVITDGEIYYWSKEK